MTNPKRILPILALAVLPLAALAGVGGLLLTGPAQDLAEPDRTPVAAPAVVPCAPAAPAGVVQVGTTWAGTTWAGTTWAGTTWADHEAGTLGGGASGDLAPCQTADGPAITPAVADTGGGGVSCRLVNPPGRHRAYWACG